MDAEGKEAPLAASKARALFVALRQLTNSDPWSLERRDERGKGHRY